MALMLVWRFFNTVSKEGPVVYGIVLSELRLIRESPAARVTSLIFSEKRVGPRIEPCSTPIETARVSDNRLSDLTH